MYHTIKLTSENILTQHNDQINIVIFFESTQWRLLRVLKITFSKTTRKFAKTTKTSPSNQIWRTTDLPRPQESGIENNPNHQIKTKIHSTYLRISWKPFPPRKIALLPSQIITITKSISLYPQPKLWLPQNKNRFRQAFRQAKQTFPHRNQIDPTKNEPTGRLIFHYLLLRSLSESRGPPRTSPQVDRHAY